MEPLTYVREDIRTRNIFKTGIHFTLAKDVQQSCPTIYQPCSYRHTNLRHRSFHKDSMGSRTGAFYALAAKSLKWGWTNDVTNSE